MKKYLLLSISVLLAVAVNAQNWIGTGAAGSTGPMYRSGNVGIGTINTDPIYNLHLKGENVVMTIEGASNVATNNNYSKLNITGNFPTLSLTGLPNPGGAAYPSINFQGLYELKYSMFPACGTGGFKIGNVSGGNAIYMNQDGSMNFGTGTNQNCYNSGRVNANYTFNSSVGVTQLLVSPFDRNFVIANGFLIGVNGKSHFNDYVSIGSATDVSANGYKFNVTGNSSFNGNVGIGTTAAPNAPLQVQSTGDISYVNIATTSTANKRTRLNFSQTNASGVNTLGMEIGSDYFSNNTNDLYIYSRTSSKLLSHFHGTSGNVGIGGAADATARLLVAGDALINGGLNVTGGLSGIAANIFNTARSGDNGCGYLNIGNKTNNNYYTFLYQANPTGGEILTINAALNGQWNNNMTLFPTGQVAIGTSTFPSNATNSKLAVSGDLFASNNITSNGVIASYKTPDAGNFAGQINLGALDPTPNNPNASAWLMANVATLNKTTDKIVFARWSPTNWVTAMSINKTGQVVIGSDDAPAAASCAKFYVDGYIASKEVRVSLTNWCDYVFDDTYKLKPLEEVEAFIKTNKHLPEIPSEKDVVENGVGLGDMSKMHMKKIEELTLYMIELKKQNDKLSEEVSALKALITNK